jgi:hypothetical protein
VTTPRVIELAPQLGISVRVNQNDAPGPVPFDT